MPALFGVACGVALALNAVLYLVLTIPVAVAGGFVAGLEHVRLREGALRGIGGAIFGASIVATHAVIGGKAKVSLPHPPILLAIVTGIGGAALGIAGAAVRRRRERGAKSDPGFPNK